jgi:hypothetical protein
MIPNKQESIPPVEYYYFQNIYVVLHYKNRDEAKWTRKDQ